MEVCGCLGTVGGVAVFEATGAAVACLSCEMVGGGGYCGTDVDVLGAAVIAGSSCGMMGGGGSSLETVFDGVGGDGRIIGSDKI